MTKLSKSFKKYIRKEKARIKREVLDIEERAKSLKDLYESLNKWYKVKFLDNKI